MCDLFDAHRLLLDELQSERHKLYLVLWFTLNLDQGGIISVRIIPFVTGSLEKTPLLTPRAIA